MNRMISKSLMLVTLSASFLFAQPLLDTGTTNTTLTPAQIAANIVTRLTMLLTLTTAEQTQATTIFTAEQTALAPLHTSLSTAQTTLQTDALANDHAGIVTQATLIGNLTTQVLEAEATAEGAFYAILTTDQQTKFKSLQSFGLLGPGGHGPGGPGPGGHH